MWRIKSTHTEKKDPYYTWYNEEAVCRRILAEFGLPGTSHIVNGHVPVQEKNGESPIKGGGTSRGHRRRLLPRLS